LSRANCPDHCGLLFDPSERIEAFGGPEYVWMDRSRNMRSGWISGLMQRMFVSRKRHLGYVIRNRDAGRHMYVMMFWMKIDGVVICMHDPCEREIPTSFSQKVLLLF
jgi:hypothetical protein